jgi:hypothetical protein
VLEVLEDKGKGAGAELHAIQRDKGALVGGALCEPMMEVMTDAPGAADGWERVVREGREEEIFEDVGLDEMDEDVLLIVELRKDDGVPLFPDTNPPIETPDVDFR